MTTEPANSGIANNSAIDSQKQTQTTQLLSASVANTYSRFPVTLVRGKGCKVWDNKGKEYLDFAAGIAVCSLGHCHPAVTEAVARQAGTLVHVSNLYWTMPQLEVAHLLTENSFADRAFFCNSGAESIEGALKLARRHGHQNRGPDCYEVICLEGSFHGRTLATIAATGQPAFQQGFEPMPSGFIHVPPNNITALKLAAGPRTAAVLIEPIQGEGGVRPVSNEFLLAAREICDRLGALLMFDEVQVGMGRTGTLFAYEQTPVVPDVMCLAKALGNGFPIGAMLAKDEVMSHLPPGSHASTFGGNPVACAAAKVVIEILTSSGFLDGVKEKGTYLKTGLESMADKHSEAILEVRGRGLIQAIEFREPVPELAFKLMKEGFLVLLSQEKILRLVPPLFVTKAEIDAMLDAIKSNI
ncbi:MAG: aspartate aminotransferase family protein [Deltaproteobacteria bacterium]|nr:aspartate aminotransferase family protein [Deltaproteobacteria bacterium]MBW1717992.1 aspartate aminotransferase family protein [Deltaproteobacteria bacterium]MBW1932485.1 aspartate aminotransferase family protein [Deltaproteobacteria bacterium]MBW1938861.1 aspartate aminotransferase family protein [Deltaproteobacteria bacterium]MBW1963738.1 aspartate aminotransferase family protein [Deltaproteobacteria bacterium]